MTLSKARIPLAGSERAAIPEARLVGAIDPNERILVYRFQNNVTVVQPHKASPLFVF